jgi:hypothetical protein
VAFLAALFFLEGSFTSALAFFGCADDELPAELEAAGLLLGVLFLALEGVPSCRSLTLFIIWWVVVTSAQCSSVN